MNKLTPVDLDKLDQLEQSFIQALKDEKLSVELEVFLRTEFGKFMGESIDKYNTSTINLTGATY
jgi:hypothetical protein